MSNTPVLKAVGLTFVAVIILAACQTELPEIPENLTQPEFFQRAQDAADENNWPLALHYYRTFIERYPDDEDNGIAAEYEIAFIHYKMEKYETSRRLFNELLSRYEADEDNSLPAWPEILSEKILAKVNEEIESSGPGLIDTESSGTEDAADDAE